MTNAQSDISSQKEVVAVVRDKNKFLLVQRRVAEGALLWNFPGGKIEAGESDFKAAEREVLEETGVKCRALRKVGERRHPDTGRLVAYVLCDYNSGNARNVEVRK